MFQTTLGAHHHRSHRKDGYQLPDGAQLITDRLRQRGYFTCNVREITPEVKGAGKTDFNFREVRTRLFMVQSYTMIYGEKRPEA